jgi:hypothetical protein
MRNTLFCLALLVAFTLYVVFARLDPLIRGFLVAFLIFCVWQPIIKIKTEI